MHKSIQQSPAELAGLSALATDRPTDFSIVVGRTGGYRSGRMRISWLRWMLAGALLAGAVRAEKPPAPAPQLPKVEPWPFPKSSDRAGALSLEQIAAKTGEFEGKIGSYPTRLRDEKEHRKVYAEWSRTVLAAEALKKEHGRSEPLYAVLAALYREGHNMDV